MRESDIQKKIIEYLSIIAGKHNLFFFSIPNESLMTALISFNVPEKTRYKLVSFYKKTGLIPGVPDLAILGNGKTFFLEVKKLGGKTNERQKRIHEIIKKTNHNVYVVDSLEKAIKIIKLEMNIK